MKIKGIKEKVFNYESEEVDYSGIRKTDKRIAGYINAEFKPGDIIINVGAGSGSYEPDDNYVIAVEPSKAMREQRLKNGKNPAINSSAENLPFDDNSFDCSTAFLTIHHWIDLEKGLNEMKRVTRNKIIIMTYNPDELEIFWNAKYFEELVNVERMRYPKIEKVKDILKLKCEIKSIPIPKDCEDGFQEAFYGRPEKFLERKVRKAQSAWGYLENGKEEELVERLKVELENGEWERKYGHFRNQDFFEGALKLLVFKKL